MDELVKMISEQAGISEAQARKAAETAVSFLKDKLPAPLASQVDNVLDNENVIEGAEGLLKKGLSLFGNK
jgi:nucleoid DNA-binding protein